MEINQNFSKTLYKCVVEKHTLSLEFWQTCSKYSHMQQYLRELFDLLPFEVFQKYVLERIDVCSEEEATVFCSIFLLVCLDRELFRTIYTKMKHESISTWIYTILIKLGPKYKNVTTTLVASMWYFASFFVDCFNLLKDGSKENLRNTDLSHMFEILDFVLSFENCVHCIDVPHEIANIIGLCTWFSVSKQYHDIVTIFRLYEKIVRIMDDHKCQWFCENSGNWIRHSGLQHLLVRLKTLEEFDPILMFTPWAYFSVHSSEVLHQIMKSHNLEKLVARITAYMIYFSYGFKGLVDSMYLQISESLEKSIFDQTINILRHELNVRPCIPIDPATDRYFPTALQFLKIFELQCRFPYDTYGFLSTPSSRMDSKHPIEDLFIDRSFYWLTKAKESIVCIFLFLFTVFGSFYFHFSLSFLSFISLFLSLSFSFLLFPSLSFYFPFRFLGSSGLYYSRIIYQECRGFIEYKPIVLGNKNYTSTFKRGFLHVKVKIYSLYNVSEHVLCYGNKRRIPSFFQVRKLQISC